MSGNDSYTKLLLHCDGADTSTTFSDVSLGGTHGNATVTGNAQVGTAQSKFGGAALLLDGTGDYLSYATNADWNFGNIGAGDFTVDFWIRINTNAAGAGLISASEGTSGWEIYFGATNTINIWHGAGTDQALTWVRSTATWYHVAIVRSGGTNTAYVNGTSLGNFASDRDWNNDSNTLYVGGASAFGGADFNGWMDEVRISKGIARWTSNFTPPTAAYDSASDALPWSERFEEFKGKKAFTDAPAFAARSIPAVGVQGVAWSQRSEPFYGQPIKFTTPQAFGQEPPTLIKGMGWFTDHDTWRPLRPFDFTSPIGAAFGPVWVATPAAEFTGTRLPLYRRGSSYWKGRA